MGIDADHDQTGAYADEGELQAANERVAQNSRNSHLPPSSDGPSAGKRLGGRKGSKSGRKRGGQKGRKGAKRELVDVSKLDELADLCECGRRF